MKSPELYSNVINKHQVIEEILEMLRQFDGELILYERGDNGNAIKIAESIDFILLE